MTGTSGARVAAIDGMRGWAALSVVLLHIFWEIFGLVQPGFRSLYTGFLFNGELPVCVFFVLSGDALSSGYWAGAGDRWVVRLAVKRYLRLTVPILASCVLVWAALASGLAVHVEAGHRVGSSGWLSTFATFPPDFLRMVGYALVHVYTDVPHEAAYNPFLWTMREELRGSFLVFFLLLLSSHLRRPLWVLVGVAALTLGLRSYMGCFVVGMLYAYVRQQGLFAALWTRPAVMALSWAGLAALVPGAGYLHVEDWHYDDGTQLFVAIALVGLVFSNRAVSGFFGNSVSQLLGRLSFPLYLVQFPVLITVTSGLILRMPDFSAPMVWAVAVVSVAACLGAALLFERVERPTAALGARLAGLLLR